MADLTWPPADTELARLFIDEKRSFGAIADLYGVTKGMVAGRCFRAGLSRGKAKSPEPPPPAQDYLVLARAPRPPEQEPRGCRWIDGHPPKPGWRYCQGHLVEGSSYCAHHHPIIWHKRRASAGDVVWKFIHKKRGTVVR